MVGKKISVKVTDLAGQVKTSEATAAVEKDLPELENVLQESANQILLMFDTDASEIAASDILVEKAEDGLVNSVEKVELTAPTTILATLSSVLIDDTVYNVTVGADSTSFTASVGEVASIKILTTEAEVNKPTKIEYQLLDENGVDVTSTQKLKETVLVDITGTYKTAKTSDPTDISVTMGAVDDECEVTISYNKGTGSDESVEPKTQKITCVGPTANKGTIKYVRTNDVNPNSECAKFYLDGVGTDGKVTIGVNETTEGGLDDDGEFVDGKPVYFSAFDDNGAAIEYDQYDVESANESIVAAKVRNNRTSGKFTVIDLTGNEVGTTQVKVIATNNTVEKEYYINVTVKNTEDMVKVILSDSRKRKLSNAYDTDYTDKITAKIVDDNGNDANYETIEWKLLNENNFKAADNVPAELQGVFGWANGVGYDNKKTAVVEAWGAKKGTYTVQATADIADTKIPQTLKITVSELPSKAWVGVDRDGQKLDYMIEVGSSSIGNIGATNSIKLYAVTNGMFAGYVRQADTVAAVATAAAVTLNTGWVNGQEDGTTFRTNKMADEDANFTADELIAAAGNVDEPDEVFTTITAIYPGGGTVKKKLTEYPWVVLPDNGDYTTEVGGYAIVEPGDATGGGAITIGLDANGDGTVNANEASTIADCTLQWTLKFGNKKLASTQLYDYLHSDAEEIAYYTTGITAVSDRATAQALDDDDNAVYPDLVDVNYPGYLTYVADNNKYDYDIARPGKIDVILTYINNDTLKSVSVDNEFTVTDTVKAFVPKVTLLTKTTEDYSTASFKEILELNVDLNNNEGLAESLVDPGLIKKWTDVNKNGYIDEDERWGIDSYDKYAKYGIVEDTVSEKLIRFFVPVGSNITED